MSTQHHHLRRLRKVAILRENSYLPNDVGLNHAGRYRARYDNAGCEQAADLAPQVETSANASTGEDAVQSNLVVDQPQTDGDAVPNNFKAWRCQGIDPTWVIRSLSKEEKKGLFEKEHEHRYQRRWEPYSQQCGYR